jgi:hypothetical protein
MDVTSLENRALRWYVHSEKVEKSVPKTTGRGRSRDGDEEDPRYI